MPRVSKIKSSGKESEIAHLLIDQRWGSRTVARYLELKYNLDIPDSSLRTWRSRRLKQLEKEGKLPEIWKNPDSDDKTPAAEVRRYMMPDDGIPDVLSRRLALIRLQEQRIALDAQHEFAMGKQFVSQGKEIQLLNSMYNDVKADMQDLGFWPKPEGVPQTVVNAYGGNAQTQTAVVSAEISKTAVEELVGKVDPKALARAGKNLALVKRERQKNVDGSAS